MRIYSFTTSNSNILKTSDLSRKKLAEVESEVEVKYWIGGTTGETGFHSILFVYFHPHGDPGRILFTPIYKQTLMTKRTIKTEEIIIKKNYSGIYKYISPYTAQIR